MGRGCGGEREVWIYSGNTLTHNNVPCVLVQGPGWLGLKCAAVWEKIEN